MPLGVRPTCSTCKTSTSNMWRKGDMGSVLCNSCYLNQTAGPSFKEDAQSTGSDNESNHSGSNTSSTAKLVINNKQTDIALLSAKDLSAVRKSSRIKPPVKSTSKQSKNQSGKGKSRRIIFKRSDRFQKPIKSHPAVSKIITRQSIFYKGIYFQNGDIVSVMDHSGEIFYAQIRGLLQDQYCEKSAIITWLIPTTASDPEQFDPDTYILGPEEELPRKMEYMEFVCHAPSNYYKTKTVQGRHRNEPDCGFIWTSIGPQVCKVPTTDEIFGTCVVDDVANSEKLAHDEIVSKLIL